MTMTIDPSQSIAFQGSLGAYSHLACLEMFPHLTPKPCESFDDAFNAVQNGDVLYAMIPIENSVAGRVADIHHLLSKTGLSIIGEHFQPVHHNLLAVPGASLDTLKTVRSHVHALSQCRNLIRRQGLKAVVATDTAGSAAEVAERKDTSVAAIASTLAAEIYGLQVLVPNIEDADHNTTRFIVMARQQVSPPRDNGTVVTSFIFRVRNVPAALYKALGGFATNGVNMTKLESYMIDGSFTATQFFADIEGHPEDPPVARALEELEYFTTTLSILGTYPADPRRHA